MLKVKKGILRNIDMENHCKMKVEEGDGYYGRDLP